jgi:hypothetical protein
MSMKPKVIRVFNCTAGTVLLLTALAKLVSSAGHAKVLILHDPIFPISFRYELMVVGAIELVVASICLFNRRTLLPTFLVAYLATLFALYRIGLLWMGYRKPCPCMGTITDLIHLSPEMADTTMKIILACLLACSYTVLFWSWREGVSQRRRCVPATPASL